MEILSEQKKLCISTPSAVICGFQLISMPVHVHVWLLNQFKSTETENINPHMHGVSINFMNNAYKSKFNIS